MNNSWSLGAARQIFNQLNEKNFNRKMQRNGLNGMADCVLSLGSRADEVLSVINDLLKIVTK